MLRCYKLNHLTHSTHCSPFKKQSSEVQKRFRVLDRNSLGGQGGTHFGVGHAAKNIMEDTVIDITIMIMILT